MRLGETRLQQIRIYRFGTSRHGKAPRNLWREHFNTPGSRMLKPNGTALLFRPGGLNNLCPRLAGCISGKH